MSDLFSLSGSYTAEPACGSPSGSPSVEAELCEKMSLIGKQLNTVTLNADGAVAIAFANIGQAHVLVVKPLGGWCDAIITTSEGVTQKIPVGQLLVHLADPAVPITALSLSRQPGVPVTVQVFLGQNN